MAACIIQLFYRQFLKSFARKSAKNLFRDSLIRSKKYLNCYLKKFVALG